MLRPSATIKSKFGRLMELANNHDFKALHGMFWQSPSTLLVAKSAIPSEGNWAGFWGNEAVDQKLHDIGSSGPVVLESQKTGLTQRPPVEDCPRRCRPALSKPSARAFPEPQK